MKNLQGKFPVILIGTGIGMPVYSGNKFCKNSGHLKFIHTENSQEVLDQYYQNNHGQ